MCEELGLLVQRVGLERPGRPLVLAMEKNDVRQLLANGIAMLAATGDRTAIQIMAILRGEGN
jgi:hypothetical protein